MVPPIRPLLTERLILRMVEEADVPAVVRYFSQNSAHLAPSHPRWPDGFFDEAYWLERVRGDAAAAREDRAVRFMLFEKIAPEDVIGSVHFSNIVRGAAQFCHLGYHLAQSKEGNGYMTEALQAAIAFAFDGLGLHRVMANHVPENERSARVLARLGFQVEGFARSYLELDGAWRDHVLTSLVRPV